jgi:hypothetical protein
MSETSTFLSQKFLEQRIEDFIIASKRQSDALDHLGDSEMAELNSQLLAHGIQKSAVYLKQHGQKESEIYKSIFNIFKNNDITFGQDNDDDLLEFVKSAFSSKTKINTNSIERMYDDFMSGKKVLTKNDIADLRTAIEQDMQSGTEKMFKGSEQSNFLNSMHKSKIFEFASGVSTFLSLELKNGINTKRKSFTKLMRDVEKSSIGLKNEETVDEEGNMTIQTAPSGLPDGLFMVNGEIGMLIATIAQTSEMEGETVFTHPLSIVKFTKMINENFEKKKKQIFEQENYNLGSGTEAHYDQIKRFKETVRKIDGILKNNKSLKDYIEDHINTSMNLIKDPDMKDITMISQSDLTNINGAPLTQNQNQRMIIGGDIYHDVAWENNISHLKDDALDTTYGLYDDTEDGIPSAYKVPYDYINKEKLARILPNILAENKAELLELISDMENDTVLSYDAKKVSSKFEKFELTSDIINKYMHVLVDDPDVAEEYDSKMIYSRTIRNLNGKTSSILNDITDVKYDEDEEKNIFSKENFNDLVSEMKDLKINIFYNGKISGIRKDPMLERYNSNKFTNEEFRAALQIFSYTGEIIKNKEQGEVNISTDAAIGYVSKMAENAIYNTTTGKKNRECINLDNINNKFDYIVKEFIEQNLLQKGKENLIKLSQSSDLGESGPVLQNISQTRYVILDYLNESVLAAKEYGADNKSALKSMKNAYIHIMTELKVDSSKMSAEEFIKSEHAFGIKHGDSKELMSPIKNIMANTGLKRRKNKPEH